MFSEFFPSQAIAFQRQAPIRPLPKKSCLKTDGRFSLRSGMCHNRRMKVATTGRYERFRGARASRTRCLASRQTHLRSLSHRLRRHPAHFGPRNDSSAFGYPARVIGSISDHGFHGFHGCGISLRFLSVESVQSVVAFLWWRLDPSLPQGLSGAVFPAFFCGKDSNPPHISWRHQRPIATKSK